MTIPASYLDICMGGHFEGNEYCKGFGYSIVRLATAIEAHSIGTNFCLYKAVSTSKSLAYSFIR